MAYPTAVLGTGRPPPVMLRSMTDALSADFAGITRRIWWHGMVGGIVPGEDEADLAAMGRWLRGAYWRRGDWAGGKASAGGEDRHGQPAEPVRGVAPGGACLTGVGLGDELNGVEVRSFPGDDNAQPVLPGREGQPSRPNGVQVASCPPKRDLQDLRGSSARSGSQIRWRKRSQDRPRRPLGRRHGHFKCRVATHGFLRLGRIRSTCSASFTRASWILRRAKPASQALRSARAASVTGGRKVAAS